MPDSDYHIDEDELLRSLGRKGHKVDETLIERARAMGERCLAVSDPRGVFRIFPLSETAEGMELEGTGIVLRGEDIRRHMHGAVSCGVLAVTLGMGPERELRRLSCGSVTDELLFNAACTLLVEQEADRCERDMRREAKGLFGTTRFSPGYGDLPLSHQPELLAILDAGRRLGISLTEDCLMLPRKSVTAVLPLFDKAADTDAKEVCEMCLSRESCELRKAGVFCGGRT